MLYLVACCWWFMATDQGLCWSAVTLQWQGGRVWTVLANGNASCSRGCHFSIQPQGCEGNDACACVYVYLCLPLILRREWANILGYAYFYCLLLLPLLTMEHPFKHPLSCLRIVNLGSDSVLYIWEVLESRWIAVQLCTWDRAGARCQISFPERQRLAWRGNLYSAVIV